MNRSTKARTSWVGVLVIGVWGLAGTAQATVRLPASPVLWVIESAAYTGTITEQIARVHALFTIEVTQDGWIQVPLTLTGGTITKAELIRKSPNAYIVPDSGSPGQYVLTASRKGTYKVRVEFSTKLSQDSQYEGVVFSIPQASFSTLSLTVPRKDVELRDADRLYVERRVDDKRGVTLEANLASAQRVDIRWSTKPAAPVKIEPMLYGDVSTLAVLENQLARLASVIDYRIAQGEIKAFTVRLPKTVQVLNVRGAGIEDWHVTEQPEANALEVTLSFTLKDNTYRLSIEGEESLQAQQATYALPEITLVGVKQERGQLAVVTEGSLEVAPDQIEGLTRIDVKEISDTLKTSSVFPIVMAFRYHQHPYHASLTITQHDDLPVLNAIAEQGELITILSGEGELLTRAAYAVRANKKQFLGVVLPEGATLWSCIVDGRSVKPVKGETGQLLVPMVAASGGDRAVIVELVYFEHGPRLARLGSLQLHGPVLDIPTTIANWLVYTPGHVKFLRTSGNLEQGGSAYAFVEDPFGDVPAAFAGGVGDNLKRIAKVSDKFEAARPNTRLREMRRDVTAYAEERGSEASLELEINKSAPGDEPSGAFKQHSGVRSAFVRSAGVVAGQSTATESSLVDINQRMQEAGILPLKIRLPKSGTIHRFNRLMTAQEALELQATYVNLPTTILPFAFLGLGLLLVSSGGVAVMRFRKF